MAIDYTAIETMITERANETAVHAELNIREGVLSAVRSVTGEDTTGTRVKFIISYLLDGGVEPEEFDMIRQASAAKFEALITNALQAITTKGS